MTITPFNTRSFYSIFILLICIGINACVKKPAPEPNTPVIQPGNDPGAFIIQEGNFQWGNASLGYVNLNTGEIERDLFRKVNDRPLGDVLQSGTIIDGKLWLVINNSGKIEVVNLNNSQSEHIIPNLTSPRYAIDAGNDKVYVSDLYANGIHIIDKKQFNKIGFIPIPGWTERMLKTGNIIWVSNLRKNYTYCIDALTDKVIDSVQTGLGNNSVVEDYSGRIWVLSTGDINTQVPAKLSCIRRDTAQILFSINFPSAGAGSLQISPDAKTLYWLRNGIWRMDVDAPGIQQDPWIVQEGIFYALSVQPQYGYLYVSNARDYVSQGHIIEYTFAGDKVRTFIAGVIPSHLIFYPK